MEPWFAILQRKRLRIVDLVSTIAQVMADTVALAIGEWTSCGAKRYEATQPYSLLTSRATGETMPRGPSLAPSIPAAAPESLILCESHGARSKR
jgi:hypothetical protein